MTKVTAKEVAARAGVSVSAVSRAYRSDAPIAEHKRKAIFAAATELGFVSNVDKVIAKSAKNTIAMVVSELHNPFYPVAIDELTRHLTELGLKAIIHVVPNGDDLDTVMRQVLDFRTEGVIFASSPLKSKLARKCREHGVPAVLLNRVQTDSNMMAVCCDNYGGAQHIAKRFIKEGRQRIAFIGGRQNTSTHLERMSGFCDYLEQVGNPVMHKFDGGFDYQQAYKAAQDLLSLRPLPDAVFCANDIMAIALLDAVRVTSVSVPEDMAVIGFDDIPMAAWEAYQLTTMRQPLRRMLKQAVEMILHADPANQTGDIRIIPADLRERRSG